MDILETKPLKILLLGNSTVGKSSFFLRYFDNKFTSSSAVTIGVDYKVKSIIVNNIKLKLNIWDTAGQDRFKSITKSYFKGSDGVLLIFDLTNNRSFLDVSQWISQIKEYSEERTKIVLVGNKCDSEERVVLKEEIEKYSVENGLIYFEASAKDNINVSEAFDRLALMIVEYYRLNPGLVRRKVDKKRLEKDNKEKCNDDCCK